MFKLDDNFLTELGLASLPPAEKNKMLSHIYETLEMKVGMRLAEKMSNEQLDEFESYINSNDEQGALKWLETNFPNYKQVVAEELEKLKAEIKQVAPQILAQAASAPQPQQPAVAGQMPQQTAGMPPQQAQTPQAPAAYGATQSAQYQQATTAPAPQYAQQSQPVADPYAPANPLPQQPQQVAYDSPQPQQGYAQQPGYDPQPLPASDGQSAQAYAPDPGAQAPFPPAPPQSDTGSFDLSSAQAAQPHVPQPGADGVASYAAADPMGGYDPVTGPAPAMPPSTSSGSVYDAVASAGNPAAAQASASPSSMGGAFDAQPGPAVPPVQPPMPPADYYTQPSAPGQMPPVNTPAAAPQQFDAVSPYPPVAGQQPPQGMQPPPVEPYQPPGQA